MEFVLFRLRKASQNLGKTGIDKRIFLLSISEFFLLSLSIWEENKTIIIRKKHTHQNREKEEDSNKKQTLFKSYSFFFSSFILSSSCQLSRRLHHHKKNKKTKNHGRLIYGASFSLRKASILSTVHEPIDTVSAASFTFSPIRINSGSAPRAYSTWSLGKRCARLDTKS